MLYIYKPAHVVDTNGTCLMPAHKTRVHKSILRKRPSGSEFQTGHSYEVLHQINIYNFVRLIEYYFGLSFSKSR